MDNKTFIDRLKQCKINIEQLDCDIIELDSQLAIVLPRSTEVNRTIILKNILGILLPEKKVRSEVYKSLVRVFNLNRLSILNRNGAYYIRAMDCSRISSNQEVSCLSSVSSVDSEKEDDLFFDIGYAKEEDPHYGFGYVEEDRGFLNIDTVDRHNFSKLGENTEAVAVAKLAETFENSYQEDPYCNIGDDDGDKELQERLSLSGIFVQSKQRQTTNTYVSLQL